MDDIVIRSPVGREANTVVCRRDRFGRRVNQPKIGAEEDLEESGTKIGHATLDTGVAAMKQETIQIPTRLGLDRIPEENFKTFYHKEVAEKHNMDKQAIALQFEEKKMMELEGKFQRGKIEPGMLGVNRKADVDLKTFPKDNIMDIVDEKDTKMEPSTQRNVKDVLETEEVNEKSNTVARDISLDVKKVWLRE